MVFINGDFAKYKPCHQTFYKSRQAKNAISTIKFDDKLN